MRSAENNMADPIGEDAFRLLVDSVRDYAIFMLDPHGRVRTWNAGAARLKQYRADEIVGRHFSTFYPPEEIASGKCELELDVATRTGRFEDEGWRVRKDGSRFWANVVISAVRGPEGDLRGFAKVTRDLTERRAAEERLRQSELRLRLLIESISEYAIFMLDERGHIATWNPGAQRIKQYTAEEIIGRHFSVFYPPEVAESGHPAAELRIAAQVGRYEEEGWRVRKDGTRFWANVVIGAVRDEHGRLVGFSKVTRDLTDRKNAEKETAARLAAEEANRAKDEFLAMLGHELRNPLAPTISALELMKARGDMPSSREQQIIERQIRHMSHLVDDLLDVSRVTQGLVILRRERIDLREAINRAVETAGPHLEDKGNQLTIDLPPGPVVVDGDIVRLTQIFTNLLTNAAKYTAVGGQIRVSTRVEDGRVVTAVADDGVGIAADLLPRIFDRFVQAPQDAGRSGGGLGLGLTIVRSFVGLHGGKVSVTSDGPGRGSTFTVALPLATAATPPSLSPGEGASEGALPALRVLLVDDNDDVLVLSAEILEMGGHEVRTASDAETALAIAAEFRPQVAVLDVGLPRMDGFTLARRLRAAMPEAPPRLIAVTGYGHASAQAQSREAGFDVHLVKPVAMEALLAAVASEQHGGKRGTGPLAES